NRVRQSKCFLVILNDQLTSLFARAVKGARLAVDVESTCEDEPADPGAPRRLENNCVAQGIRSDRFNRIYCCCRDIRDSGKVVYDIGAGDGITDSFFVKNVRDN